MGAPLRASSVVQRVRGSVSGKRGLEVQIWDSDDFVGSEVRLRVVRDQVIGGAGCKVMWGD